MIFGRMKKEFIETKQDKFSIGHGMQQALTYAEMLDSPFAISSNGDGFLLHDRTGISQPVDINLAIEAIANDLQRLLPVVATGTGKTYTAF